MDYPTMQSVYVLISYFSTNPSALGPPANHPAILPCANGLAEAVFEVEAEPQMALWSGPMVAMNEKSWNSGGKCL